MSELPVRARKCDVLKGRLGLGQSVSLGNQQSTDSAVSNTPPVQAPALPSTPGTLTPTQPVQDLWQEALQTLSKEDWDVIDRARLVQATKETLSGSIEELLSLVRSKQNECEKGCYEFRFRGKKIILRDVAEKIVFWLNRFKDIGDVAVNFDPVHASLPWAGVRFLLQVAVAGHEQMGGLLVSVEKVTCLTRRCTIYEILYNAGTVPAQVLDNLHEALIRLYAATLQLLAVALRLFNKKTATRAMHALINPTEISDLISKCDSLETQVEIEAQNCERMRSKAVDIKVQELLDSLRKPVLRTDERVSQSLEILDARERIEILEWISKILYGKHHDTVREQRTKSTCDWLLRHEHYQEWQDTSSSLTLWLHGIPGSGKTFLTSRVIDEIQDTLKSNPNHEGLAFFYCNRNEIERQEPLSVLRSFVRQLSTIANDEDCMEKRLRQYYIQARVKASEPTMEECKKLLLDFINLYPKTTLILDALDECDKHKRYQLVETFDYLLDYALKPVKIFISSRPDGDIREIFQKRTNVEIRASDNHHDISKFVESEITKHRRWNKMSAELQNEIIHTIQNRSQGMFQWAYLQIRQLLDLRQERDIRDRLGKLPADLKDSYDEIYYGMSENERKIADRAFQWVMCACVPLSTKALLKAVCQDGEDDTIKAVDDLDEDLLLEYCHNFLVIDSNREVWMPSHLSVIEYFENHLWSQEQANCLVARVCLLKLLDRKGYDEQQNMIEVPIASESDESSRLDSVSSDLAEFENNGAFYSLAFYARHHWMIHVQRCEEDDIDDQLYALLNRFLGSPTESSFAYQDWYTVLPISDYQLPDSSYFRDSVIEIADLEPHSSPLFAVCAFGFYTILSRWTQDYSYVEIQQKNLLGRSLLQIAAMTGSFRTCKYLIDWGVEVNEHLQTPDYGSALAAAASCNYGEIVQLLLESGAEVNAQLQLGKYGTALVAAAYLGKIDMMKLLIEYGADVNAQVQFGICSTALIAAVYCGKIDTVKLLIENRLDVNAQIQFGKYGTALVAAAEWAQIDIMKLLIEYGADVNAQVQFGDHGTALVAAAYWGQIDIVKLLIEYGVDVNTQVQFGNSGTALVATAYLGQTATLKLLIGYGADVNAQLQFGNYGTALVAAAHWGEIDIVKLLIEYGADVNAQCQLGDYGSALVAATQGLWDAFAIVKLLLESGADVNMHLFHGIHSSALKAAEYRGDESIIQLLKQYGAKHEPTTEKSEEQGT